MRTRENGEKTVVIDCIKCSWWAKWEAKAEQLLGLFWPPLSQTTAPFPWSSHSWNHRGSDQGGGSLTTNQWSASKLLSQRFQTGMGERAIVSHLNQSKNGWHHLDQFERGWKGASGGEIVDRASDCQEMLTLFVIYYKIRSDNLKDQRIKQALAFDLSMIQSQISFNSKQQNNILNYNNVTLYYTCPLSNWYWLTSTTVSNWKSTKYNKVRLLQQQKTLDSVCLCVKCKELKTCYSIMVFFCCL